MTDGMVLFDSGELEIAIATYNRCEFVAEWLDKCYEQARERNIVISIWDSSTNDDTENYIHSFKLQKGDASMEYHRADSETHLGYKPMLPLLYSTSKYVWVSGDTRYPDFEMLDRTVFPVLKKDIDYVVLGCIKNEENDGRIYTDKEQFLRDCFVSITCLGLSIYKTALFEPLKSDKELREICDSKYKDNYAFGWIGYFLEMFFLKEYKAFFSFLPIVNIKPDKKVPSWFSRYYHCWIEDLCNLLDALSDKYHCTDRVIRETWKYLAHDLPTLCCAARKSGDLNYDTYKKYRDNGMLARCTPYGERLKAFACASDEELDSVLEQEQAIEKKEFEVLCRQKIEEIKTLSECCQGGLYLYGAGKGGQILAECLAEHGIIVRGILDKEAQAGWLCCNLPVLRPGDVSLDNCLVVISLLTWQPFIVSSLVDQGVERSHIYYIYVADSCEKNAPVLSGRSEYR